jgi:hypothetical protein
MRARRCEGSVIRLLEKAWDDTGEAPDREARLFAALRYQWVRNNQKLKSKYFPRIFQTFPWAA